MSIGDTVPLNTQVARSPKFGSHSPSSFPFSSNAQSDQKEADAKLIDNSNLLKDRSAPLSGNSDPLPFPDYKVHPPKPTWGRFFCDVLTVGTWLLATTVAALALNHFCGFNMAAACIGAWVAVSAGVLALSCHCTGHIRVKRTLNNLESHLPRLSKMYEINRKDYATNATVAQELKATAADLTERVRRQTESEIAHNEKVKSDNHAFERRRTELEARTSIIDQFIPATLKSPPRPSQDQGSASLAGQNLTEESDQKYVAASPKHLAVPSSPASLSLTPIPTSSVSASPSDLMQSPPPAPFLNKDLDSQSVSPPTTGPTLHVAPTLPLPSTPASKDVTSPFVTPEPRLSSSSAMTLAANTDAVAASIVGPGTVEKVYQPLNAFSDLISSVGAPSSASRLSSSSSLSTPASTNRASSPVKEKEEERKVAHSRTPSAASTPGTTPGMDGFFDAFNKNRPLLANARLMFVKMFAFNMGDNSSITKVHNKFKLQFGVKVEFKFKLSFDNGPEQVATLKFPAKTDIMLEIRNNEILIDTGKSEPVLLHYVKDSSPAVIKLSTLQLEEHTTTFKGSGSGSSIGNLLNRESTNCLTKHFAVAVKAGEVLVEKNADANNSVEKVSSGTKEADVASASADKASPTSTPTTNKTQPATTPTPPISLLETHAGITSEDATS